MKYIYLLSFLLLGCSNSNDYTTLDSNSKIVAFGDSLTYGYGSTKSYPEYLEEILQVEVINSGINGETTQGGLNRIKKVLEEENPDLIIIGLGGNDMLRRVSPKLINDNLREIIKITKSKNVQVVLLAEPKAGLLNFASKSTSIGLSDGEVYSELSKEFNILNIDDILSDLLSNEEFKSDMIHLNNKGYKELAEHIAKRLKDNKIIE